jgi:hypothetical protein
LVYLKKNGYKGFSEKTAPAPVILAAPEAV